jgi:hypothetical protein
VLQLVLLVLYPAVFFSCWWSLWGLTVVIGRTELAKRGGVLAAVLAVFVLVPHAAPGVFGPGGGDAELRSRLVGLSAGAGAAVLVLPVVAVLLIAGVLGQSGSWLKQINSFVGKNFITKYGTKQGIIVLGRVAPFGIGIGIGIGIGAVIGGGANATVAALAVRAARRAFGPRATVMARNRTGSRSSRLEAL